MCPSARPSATASPVMRPSVDCVRSACGRCENECTGGMIRVVAAGKVLDVALKLHEQLEVEQRLKAVEAALEAQLAKGNR